MAKKDIKNIEARMKQKKKLRKKRNIKDFFRNALYKPSLIANILMGLYIYDSEIYIKLFNQLQEFYQIFLNNPYIILMHFFNNFNYF